MNLLDFAYNNNSFYRKRFDNAKVHPSEIRSPSDLVVIPILTKKEIKENMKEIISNGYRMEELLEFRTGGSTGKSLVLYITEECSELRNACARRHDCWTGWRPGEPIGAVWGNPKLPSTLKAKIRQWLLSPCIYLDTMNVNDAAVERFAREWKKARPTLLFGHAHSLYILANYVKRLGIDEIRPKGILSTSMMLMPHERKVIEGVFDTKVTDRYGCEEVSLIASECERHEGMHLNIEHLYIEFLKENGFPASPGEMGRIIVTDLMNKAMPFIRYDVEDLAIHIQKECSCGRGLPLMDGVMGRTADFLVKKDRSRVAGISIIENTLTSIQGIEQMQIIQNSVDFISVKIVPGDGYSIKSEKDIIEYFKNLFGNECAISLMHVDRIESEPSGKYRFSVCRISDIDNIG